MDGSDKILFQRACGKRFGNDPSGRGLVKSMEEFWFNRAISQVHPELWIFVLVGVIDERLTIGK